LNQERFQQPQPFNWEGRAIVDGVVKWFRIFSSPDLLGDGDVLWHGVIADITDRKQAEAVLIQTRKNYEAFFNTIDEFLFVLDEQGNIIHLNTTVIERLGYTREELAGQSVLMVHPPERRNEAGRIVGEMLSGAAEFCPVPIITKSGIQIPVETIVSRGFWDGSPVIFGVTKDISKVRLSEEKFSKLFHINPSACGLSDLNDHKYIEVNEAFYTLLGFDKEEVIGKTACDLGILTAEARNAILLKADTEGNITNAEADLKAKNGDIKHVLLSSESIHVQENKYRFTVVYDITDRKRAEAEKEKMEAKNRQLQKSESLGRMAGAISHTFNNQLGVVIGNLELAMMELPRGAMSHAKIIEAMKACNKAAEISGLMLIYLGQSFDDHKPIDLSDVCRKTLPMLKTVMLAKVVIKADLPSPGPIIMANENHIQQVLINLTTNAWEAIGENQGMIHLKVKTVSPEGIPVANRFPVGWQPQDSPYACLEVTDTAAGIADKDIEKIFDPFFSTKFTGRGMGLAVVQGIVRTHNGVATVASEPGNGSTFRIFIPVSAAEGRQPDKVADDSEVLIGSVSPAKLEGVGSVLLVEDEEMVRNVAAALIKRLGFIVFEAKDGVEAVEVFREHQNEIKCVLCDLTMPRMNGWETLTALRKLAPGIPVILASGYDKAQVMSGDHPELPQVFLGKPYNLKDLSNAIKDALADKT
jgi:PAS domain S-box-containing protein